MGVVQRPRPLGTLHVLSVRSLRPSPDLRTALGAGEMALAPVQATLSEAPDESTSRAHNPSNQPTFD